MSCKRWKVARTGIEPLRELDRGEERAGRARMHSHFDGDISDNARAFAMEKSIQLVGGPELARLLPDLRGGRA